MNTIELLQLLSIIAFISAGVIFLVAVALFFLLNIPKITGDLSGRTARKAIEKKKKNSLEGISNDAIPANMRGNPAEAVTFSHGIGTEKIASMRLSKQNPAVQKSSGSQTTVLEPPGSQTTVLESPGSQTTVLETSGSQTTVLESPGSQIDMSESSGNQTTLLKPQGNQTAGQAVSPSGAVMQSGIQNADSAPRQSVRQTAATSAQTANAGNSPEFGQTIELDETNNEQTSNSFGETILLSAAGAGTGLGSQKEIGFSSSSEIIE